MMIDVDIVMNCNKKWNRKEGIEMNSIDDCCCWLWLHCNCNCNDNCRCESEMKWCKHCCCCYCCWYSEGMNNVDKIYWYE